MSFTIITYGELSALLEVDMGTLRHAVSRGVLTRLPKQGLTQPFIKEQAMLFAGKKRLSLNSLNPSERELWIKYAHEASDTQKEHERPQSANIGELAALGALAGAGTLALVPMVLPTAGTGTGVPQGNPFPVLPVLLKIIR